MPDNQYPRSITDILIGSDNAELMTAKREVTGVAGEPVAHLTPLGWTCIGRVPDKTVNNTNFTYFNKRTICVSG